jgi:acetyl-CoA carboxylase biotin carboxylase subunit
MQRRHQKIIEEAPAPGISARALLRVGERAADACRKIAYRGAGTFEFLYQDDEFLLHRDEHARAGRASGDGAHHGHRHRAGADPHRRRAEAALSPARRRQARPCDRMPHQRRGSVDLRAVAGTITAWHPPGGPGIRVDSHAYANYFVPPHYDSMIGKVIAYGDTREQAFAAMRYRAPPRWS